MMSNYALIIATELERDHELPQPAGLVVSLRTRTMSAMLGQSDRPIALGETGIIIGDLYHRHGPTTQLSAVDPATLLSLEAGDFSRLLSFYWGSYIAAIETKAGVVVFRDPSATCPCYYIQHGSRLFFGSDVATLLRLSGAPIRIDWNGVGQYLIRTGLPSTLTALEGICELLPGNLAHVAPGPLVQRAAWSPWSFVAARENAPRLVMIEGLGNVVRSCVSAQARKFSQPVITVSGGLDSSIVAAVAAGVCERPVGLTMYTDDLAGDERPFSEILCNALRMELVARLYRTADIDVDVPCSPHLPRPVGRTQATAYEGALIELARETGADGFLTGNGGDNVFSYSRSARAVVDSAIRRRNVRETLRTLQDISRQTSSTYLEVARAALRLYRNQRAKYIWRPNFRFLRNDVLSLLPKDPLTHDWLNAPRGALPGQFAHIAALLRVQQNLIPRRAAVAPVVNPLLAQPIMEFSLGIPSWEWCSGGRDRSVARDAFAADLPKELVSRRVKGTPDGFTAQVIDHFRKEIRERLLEGNLARQGLLDKPTLERTLSDQSIDHAHDRPRILDLLDTEAWIGHWRL